MSYSEKLKDPRWQKKRLRILERNNWECISCGDKTSMLVVHHTYYKGEPWEVEDKCLHTLCQTCHNIEHEERVGAEQDLLLIMKQNGFLLNDIQFITSKVIQMGRENGKR